MADDNSEKIVESEKEPEKSAASSSTKDTKDNKVHILLLPTGNTPIIQKKNFKINANLTVGHIKKMLREWIKVEPTEALFIYVNQIFAPSLEQTVQNLYNCFESEGKLTLYYSKSPAWG